MHMSGFHDSIRLPIFAAAFLIAATAAAGNVESSLRQPPNGLPLPFQFPLIASRSPALTNESPTDAVPATPTADGHAELNPALRRHTDSLASSNLSVKTTDGKPAEQKPRYQTLIEQAREQRAQKSYLLAAKNFIGVLELAATPEELKRTALLELALLAQEQNELAKAQQIFSQFLKRWPEDPSVPEVLLRQGLIYRQMGTPTLAMARFYAVMTSSLTLKFGSLDYYKRLVLHAQTEIADTYFLEGKLSDAAEFFQRLLKQDAPDLNKPQIHYKLVRCLSGLTNQTETIAQAQEFLSRYPAAPEQAELRFLLASSLKQLGRNHDALQQVLLLLKSQEGDAESDPAHWNYWQRRAGNEIANQLYLEGDYVAALEIYLTLARLDASPGWQLPVWYQVGLAYEKLQQPEKARESYARIVERQKDLKEANGPGLRTVVDMAKWRSEFLSWQTQTARDTATNAAAALPPTASP